MAEYDFDIGVIGGGAAGLTVTAGAAQAGAKTLLVEESLGKEEKDINVIIGCWCGSEYDRRTTLKSVVNVWILEDAIDIDEEQCFKINVSRVNIISINFET